LITFVIGQKVKRLTENRNYEKFRFFLVT
jgi:hypothetical protein